MFFDIRTKKPPRGLFYLTIVGCALPSITSFVTLHSFTVSSEGIVYITSIMAFSMIVRSPLAPVFCVNASSAIWSMASSSKESFTPSYLNSFWYCFTSAFLGSERIFLSACLSSPSKATLMGTRPTNSGISPNLTRSCVLTWASSSPISSPDFWAISALNPMDLRSRSVKWMMNHLMNGWCLGFGSF